MKFTANQGVLLKLIAECASATKADKNTSEILSNLKLELENNQLTVTATDLEVQIKGFIDVEQVAAGSITVPAKKFVEIVKNVSGAIEFTLDDAKNENGNPTATIRSGRSRFKLQTLPATDFPDIQGGNVQMSFSCSASDFVGALGRISYAMANQDVRYYLNGAYVEFNADKSVIFVATDGHRLSKTKCNAQVKEVIENTLSFIIPRKSVHELSKIANNAGGEVHLGFTTNHVYLHAGNRIVASKLIDGRFPDYRRVILDVEKTLSVNRFDLRGALQRVAITSNEKYRLIRMDLAKHTLTLSASNPEHEESEEMIQCAIDIADPISIGMNVNYLLEAINTIPEEDVTIKFHDPNSSIKIESADETVQVIMPARL